VLSQKRVAAGEPVGGDGAIRELEKALGERRLAAVLLQHAVIEGDRVESSQRAWRDPLSRRFLPNACEPALESLAGAAADVRRCGGDQAGGNGTDQCEAEDGRRHDVFPAVHPCLAEAGCRV
jgi:hypothetical protein